MSLKQPEPDKKFPEIAFEKKSHLWKKFKNGASAPRSICGGGDSKDLPKGSENPAVSAVRF